MGKVTRAGFVAPILACLFAALLADMAWQQYVRHAEATSGAWAADRAAEAMSVSPSGRLAATEGLLLRVVRDDPAPRRYRFLPKLTYRAHPAAAGQALDAASDADKAAADAWSEGRHGRFSRRVGAVWRAAVPMPQAQVAVADVPAPDWSSEAATGRIAIIVALLGALAFWLPLLRRQPLRPWYASAGAGVAAVVFDAALFVSLDLLGAQRDRLIDRISGLVLGEGVAPLIPERSAGLLVLAAPLLPLVIAGAVGWVTRSRRSPHRAAYAYIGPAMVGMSVLILVPFVFGLLLAFTRHDHGTFTFVGLRNFIHILKSEGLGFWEPLSFYFTLAVTIGWTALNVVLHAALGLALALVLKEPTLRFKGVYRVLLIVPWAVPNYITALIWKGMFNKQYGLINHLLGSVGVEPVGWFSGFWTAFAANVTTNTWLGFPFMMVVALGALQSIPKDLYEAADVDGASTWDKFREITLPLLKPAMVPALILGSIWTFNMFNIIYLVSGGQPNSSTDILITEAYRWAFEQDRYGYAAAYSVLIFLILLGYSAITNKISKGAEATYG